MVNTGILTLQQAKDLEVVGVAARASGRNIDARRDRRTRLMTESVLACQVYLEGDVLARIRVRVDEVTQSCFIIRQVLEQIEPGPICAKLPAITTHRRGMGWTESAKGETVH